MEERKGGRRRCRDAWKERRKGWLTSPLPWSMLYSRCWPSAGDAPPQGSLGVPAEGAGLSAVESGLSGADGSWINCFPPRQELGKKDSETEQPNSFSPCLEKDAANRRYIRSCLNI